MLMPISVLNLVSRSRSREATQGVKEQLVTHDELTPNQFGHHWHNEYGHAATANISSYVLGDR
jgi:hypothetical protein